MAREKAVETDVSVGSVYFYAIKASLHGIERCLSIVTNKSFDVVFLHHGDIYEWRVDISAHAIVLFWHIWF